jgi:CRISPR-associated protein Cas2
MLSQWWMDAFPQAETERFFPHTMLTLIGYDITSPRRLSRIAKTCEDYGVRVQYSIFECHLDEQRFEKFWAKLLSQINPEKDRLVAYQIDAKSARRTRTAGTMVCSEKVVVYLI